jgi:hypothetical protein
MQFAIGNNSSVPPIAVPLRVAIDVRKLYQPATCSPNQELQDYLRELRDWEAKVKAKDQMLKGGSGAAPPSAVAPVRGQLKTMPEPVEDGFSKAKAPALEEKGGKKGGKGSGKSGKNAAGHTYDYFRDKWDKFDMVSTSSLNNLQGGWLGEECLRAFKNGLVVAFDILTYVQELPHQNALQLVRRDKEHTSGYQS